MRPASPPPPPMGPGPRPGPPRGRPRPAPNAGPEPGPAVGMAYWLLWLAGAAAYLRGGPSRPGRLPLACRRSSPPARSPYRRVMENKHLNPIRA